MSGGDANYRKVYETLKREILNGAHPADRPFPSSTALSRRFGFARFTIRQALDILVKEGLIKSSRGRGTFMTKMGANRQIGLIVPGISYSEFFQPIVTALSGVCAENGYGLSIGSAFSAESEKRVQQVVAHARDLVAKGVRGVIFQPIEMEPSAPDLNRQIGDILQAAGVSVVMLDSDIVPQPERSKLDLVGIDNYGAGRRVVRHLLGQGVRKLCFASHPYPCNSIEARWRGAVSEAATCKNATIWRFECGPQDEACIRRNVARRRPEAIICGYDTFAAYVKCAIAKDGMKVPEDVLLTGFDDLQDAVLMTPALTTIHQPCSEIAREAFFALIRRMENPSSPPREILLNAPLVVRASTRRNRMPKAEHFVQGRKNTLRK